MPVPEFAIKKGVIAHDALEKIFSVITSTLKLESEQAKLNWARSHVPLLLDCIQFAQVLHKDNAFTSKMLGKGMCCLEALASHILVKRPFEDYTTSGSSKFDADVQLQTTWMKLQVFTSDEIMAKREDILLSLVCMEPVRKQNDQACAVYLYPSLVILEDILPRLYPK